MTLLSNTIQPPLLTLLSSTSDPAISPLFTVTEDPDHPTDAFVAIVPDNDPSSSTAKKKASRHYVSSEEGERGNVIGQVVHIQSPDPRRTYIQAGSRKGKGKADPLGIELPWVGLQVKRLGRRGMSMEFGVIDTRGREGVIRLSSYQTEPKRHTARDPPLIHLPLQLPNTDQHTLTSWLDIKLNLASLLPLFESLPPPSVGEKRRKIQPGCDLPNEQLGHVSYVRVYANCRLRRIWFSANGETTLRQAGVEDEWGLYAATLATAA